MTTFPKGLHFRLGASMYCPATHKDVLPIANGEKYPNLRSIIFCTEDAIRADEVEAALRNLKHTMSHFTPQENLMRFIRVRSPEVLGKLLRTRGISNIDGFVLPKITAQNLHLYTSQLTDRDPYLLMPTLETVEATSELLMRQLLDQMMDDRIRRRILSLRIGGNDLLNVYRLRRQMNATIYGTPVGNHVIPMLVTVFKPHGFNLTAPVFEGIDFPELLQEELVIDQNHGLFGKTAIHPSQIQVIEASFRVPRQKLAEARAILEPNAPAVFKMNGAMCEPTTHMNWAEDILERAGIYGLVPDEDAAVTMPRGRHPELETFPIGNRQG